jgi:hypothetical protein
MEEARLPTYVAFSVSRDTGYVGVLQADGTYSHYATCNNLKDAKELADALNDREDLRRGDGP